MEPNQYTPLRTSIKVLKYSPIQKSRNGDAESNSGRGLIAMIPNGYETTESKKLFWSRAFINASIAVLIILLLATLLTYTSQRPTIAPYPKEGAAWSAIAQPLSLIDPETLGFIAIDRPEISMPGPIFGDLLLKNVPLPTNSWCENFFLGNTNTASMNRVFQLPYVIDTESHNNTQGVNTHPAHVQANDRTVEMTYEPRDGVSLGATERFSAQHHVSADTDLALARLSTVLEWKSHEYLESKTGPFMKTAIVRGTPYTSMEYKDATPRIIAQRPITFSPVIDNDPSNTLECGDGDGVFSSVPKLVTSEISVHFDISDFTWLIFVSEPTLFSCSNKPEPQDMNNFPPGFVPPVVEKGKFELKAMSPMINGMVRVALGNNCTTGQNARYCSALRHPTDQSEYMQLLRNHSDVYPTGKADVRFTFPVESETEEELRLNFNWEPAHMSHLANGGDDDLTSLTPMLSRPEVELLMFAIPHQQERLIPTEQSSNKVYSIGCTPTLHGVACPVTGGSWSMLEHLHRVSFTAPRSPRNEMITDIRRALQTDIHYALPDNYMRGAGDTYFSGKMLSKLARIIIVADEVGGVNEVDFKNAVHRLKSGVEIWLNGSAESPLLYDKTWGGIVMCGCVFDGVKCANKYPDCPALTDQGQNFGAGFYNDHHFHFGYHIYAAAVASKFDGKWGRKFHERVLLLVRDIANPSASDPYFPTWRHKDWYLGFSWASGVVTLQGVPYPNGRNEESSSEAISAYEAVALYGEVAASLYKGDADPEGAKYYDNALRLRDMGRLLLATEVRSAKTYWHVQSPGAPSVSRIYPEIYTPKVVGMLWSMLAQEQTWFGAQPWKSYGIQMIPLTPASELRDDPQWVEEMLPSFEESCSNDKDCGPQGWSVLVYAAQAEIGQWREAWKNLNKLHLSVYTEAGGNGHSKSNSLWYVSTRPDYKTTGTRTVPPSPTPALKGNVDAVN